MLNINEAATPYNIIDPEIAKKTASRIQVIHRTMDQLERAIEEAKAQNKLDKVSIFEQRLQDLQNLIDGIIPAETDAESNTGGNSSGESTEDNKDSKSSEADEPNESSEEAENKPKSSDEMESEDESEAESETETADESEEDTEDETNPAEETEESSEEAAEKEPGRSTKTSAKHSSADDSEGQQQQSNSSQEAESESNSEAEKDTESESEPESEVNSESEAEPNTEDEPSSNEQESSQDSASQDEENPFADGLFTSNEAQGDDQQKDISIEKIISILKQVEGEGADGIKQALLDILDKRGVHLNLSEALKPLPNKSLEQLSDDEFNDIINNTLDEVDTVIALPYLDAADKKQRTEKIKSDMNNIVANRALDIEDNVNLQPERAKIAARERELQKYNNFKSISDFKINFWRAINDQVEKYEESEETFARINKKHEDPVAFKRGKRTVEKWKEEKPIIDIYFDQSRSWTDDKAAVEMGQSIVKTMDEFKRKDQIELNVYYFSNRVVNSIDDPSLGGGTGAWTDILQTIKANGTKNVVLMTDSDMYYDAESGPNCVVDGCVWIIWRHGSQAESIPKHLQGRLGTYQYAF